MAQYKNYVIAQTLDEAYALNAKKSTVIVAGNMWLRMCGMRRQTALDLSALGLDFIKEDEQGFTVGAMTTLRTMETHAALNTAFGGVFARAFEPIVGTQFRNGATVGGSVFSRFGFSDVSTLLLARPEELEYMRMAADIPMGSNARASEAYRRKVAPVLMERAVQACLKR